MKKMLLLGLILIQSFYLLGNNPAPSPITNDIKATGGELEFSDESGLENLLPMNMKASEQYYILRNQDSELGDKLEPDWMRLFQEDQRVFDVCIPGTHDSAMHRFDDTIFARTQKFDIKEQLMRGVRALDLRVGMWWGTTTLKLGHGTMMSDYTLDRALGEIKDFLTRYPTETVICIFDVETPSRKNEVVEATEGLLLGHYSDYVYAPDENSGYSPTFRDARGKMIYVHKYWSSLKRGYHITTRDNCEYLSTIDPMRTLYGTNENFFCEDTYKTSISNKVECVTYHIAETSRAIKDWRDKYYGGVHPLPAPTKFFWLTHVSGYRDTSSGGYLCPESFANHVNPKVYAWLCNFRSMYIGIVMFDFYTSDLGQTVWAKNFYNPW